MESIFTNSPNGAAARSGQRGERTGRMGGEYTDGNGVTWEYKEVEAGATCSIWPKNRSSISGRVEIPGTVEVDGVSIKVVSIGKEAFYDCGELQEVTIPGSVTEIGAHAFRGCSGLTAVTIPGSVTVIGDDAFSGCSGLTAVTIPGSVTEIGEYAFLDCSGLTAVTIPSSVTVIRAHAFEGCSGLTAVTIPSSVTVIGEYAFLDCSGLTAVTIPGSVMAIGDDAFSGCSGLNAVYWLAGDGCDVGLAFHTTLYVRQGEKAIIEGQWTKGFFSAIVEGYVVTFTDSDGNKLGEQLVKPNGTATEPAAPIKEGFTFEEWQLGGKKYDFSKPVMKNIKLLAVWKKK